MVWLSVDIVSAAVIGWLITPFRNNELLRSSVRQSIIIAYIYEHSNAEMLHKYEKLLL